MKPIENLKPHKMPKQSLFFDRIVPSMFIILILVTLALIIFGIGIITNIIPWS